MKTWIVRFVVLYVFNLLVLWAMGFFLSSVSVGFGAFWGAFILTLGTFWVRPVVTKWFKSMAAGSASKRTKVGEKLVQAGLVLGVSAVVWVLVVVFSGVSVRSVWGWILPPIMLLIAWAIYDAIAGKLEAQGHKLYDKAMGGPAVKEEVTVTVRETRATRAGRDELKDGLTPEQRKMLDELGGK